MLYWKCNKIEPIVLKIRSKTQVIIVFRTHCTTAPYCRAPSVYLWQWFQANHGPSPEDYCHSGAASDNKTNTPVKTILVSTQTRHCNILAATDASWSTVTASVPSIMIHCHCISTQHHDPLSTASVPSIMLQYPATRSTVTALVPSIMIHCHCISTQHHDPLSLHQYPASCFSTQNHDPLSLHQYPASWSTVTASVPSIMIHCHCISTQQHSQSAGNMSSHSLNCSL